MWQKHGAGSRGLGKEKEKELRREKGVRKKRRGQIMEERGLWPRRLAVYTR